MALDDIVGMGFEYARMVPWMEPKTNKRKRRKRRGFGKNEKMYCYTSSRRFMYVWLLSQSSQ